MRRNKRPLIVNCGGGLDSMAILVEFARTGVRPDLVIFANTGGEKPETMRYIQSTIRRFLAHVGFPKLTVVRYEPKKFKNFPPYHDLETNCLSNGTLPSLAFGFKSCSIKWKAAAIDAWVNQWALAQECWKAGKRVVKVIGYDASPADIRRRNHVGDLEDPKYQYRYPLIEWEWTRNRCITEVVNAGLPGWDPAYLEAAKEAETVDDMLKVRRKLRWIQRGGIPMKSSCFFCPAMQKWEVALLGENELARIVMMEARAKPRLEGYMTQAQLDERYDGLMVKWERKVAEARADGSPEPKRPRRKKAGEKGLTLGLWRSGSKNKPGSMTEFIETRGLLSKRRIRELERAVPKRLRRNVDDFRKGMPIEDWDEFAEGVGVTGFCIPDKMRIGGRAP